MQGDERRQKLVELLKQSTEPISGTSLAKTFGVSRQIIVQDIALIKSRIPHILSTHRGYLMQQQEECERVFWVRHTNAQMEDELNTIVDNGGTICNVIVEHEIYGMITVDLVLHSRKNIQDFIKKIEHSKARPLKEITLSGHHGHLVQAKTEQELDLIEQELRQRGYLA